MHQRSPHAVCVDREGGGGGGYYPFMPPCMTWKGGAQKWHPSCKQSHGKGGGGMQLGRGALPSSPCEWRLAREWEFPLWCAVLVAMPPHPLPWLSTGVTHNEEQCQNGKPGAPPFPPLPCGPLPIPALTNNPTRACHGHHPKFIPRRARAPPLPILCTAPPENSKRSPSASAGDKLSSIAMLT